MGISNYTLVTGAFGGLGTAIVHRLIASSPTASQSSRPIAASTTWTPGSAGSATPSDSTS